MKQAAAELDEARITLGYTEIRSPVDGVVVSRNVDVGQTVAASFQTPTLFAIAQDLTKMQVNANVSESDIGGCARPARRASASTPIPAAASKGACAGAQCADRGAERGDLRRRDRRRQPPTSRSSPA